MAEAYGCAYVAVFDKKKRKDLHRTILAILSLIFLLHDKWVFLSRSATGRASRLPTKITDFHGAPSGCDLANVDESSDAPAVGNC